VTYSQTKDGANWTARNVVSQGDGSAFGVGWAGRTIVLYSTYEWYGTFMEVRTRN
jgi:hypothetical protein